MHEKHRERVREKYKANGLEGFAAHEVLELLLFYSNKRSDTNPVAHRLIERFGSLPAVLEASYDDLLKVDGVGDATATLISLIPELFRRYHQDKTNKIKSIKSADDAKSYLIPKFFGVNNERVGMVCLDAQGRINNFIYVTEGSLKMAQVDIRKAAQLALQNNAESVIIVHNHPDGVATPSRSDVEATKALINAFGTIGIRVADHIIVNDSEVFSMASSFKFSPLFMVEQSSAASEKNFNITQSEQIPYNN